MFASICHVHLALHQLPVAVTCTPQNICVAARPLCCYWLLVLLVMLHTLICLIQCSNRLAAAGAPRTGNHAFARIYMQHVPDTWHMINNQVGLDA